MTPISAIQFIGTQRSGSNLLRVMLNQLPEISAPHPPHILKTFFPLLAQYYDLTSSKGFRILVKDVCEWVNGNPVPWGFKLDSEQVFKNCNKQSLIEIFVRIHELKAQYDGARIWCCKSMESVGYIEALEREGVNPLYVHLYRDGRDVALSFLKAIVGPKHVYFLSKKWKEEQALALKAKKLIPKNRFFSIKYEDLLQNPKGILTEFCSALGIKFNEATLDYFLSRESHSTAESGAMWGNLVKPLLTENHHKYLKELSNEQINIFEYVAGEMLEDLGYPCITNYKATVLDSNQIDKFSIENQQAIDRAIKEANPDDLAKRKPQDDMMNAILKRRFTEIESF